MRGSRRPIDRETGAGRSSASDPHWHHDIDCGLVVALAHQRWVAGQVDRENAVFLFNSAGDPTLMREGNDETAVYVVMPMRV